MVKGAVLHGPELHAIAKALQLDPNAAEEGDIVDSFENYLGRRGEVVIAATKALAGEDPDQEI